MHPEIFEPNRDLALFIKCYWTLESSKKETPKKNIIVPDGHMKMIFHYGDLYKQHRANRKAEFLPRCFVIGQLTRPLELEPVGDTGTFVVVFEPNGFRPFTSQPLNKMDNTAVSLEDLFAEKGRAVETNILRANTAVERIDIIEAFLFERLRDEKNIKHILKSTIETVLTANGQLSVDELSKQTRISRRQLERAFSLEIGVSPKQLLKTIRLQAALKLMLNQNTDNLATLAYRNQYYDQSHFNKDFKEFTGLTPKEFYGEDLKMSFIFDKKK